MTLVAIADVALDDADRYLSPICEHLSGHGLDVREGKTHATVTDGKARGRLEARAGWMTLRAEANDMASLLSLRASLAAHLKEFADAAGSIAWRGDGVDAVEPPEFRRLHLERAEDVTPGMRRLTFRGNDLARFATERHLHCKLLFPPPGAEPIWPALGSDGLIHWPEGKDRLAVRKYTIRRVDPDAGRIEIDFVRHERAGPGSAFAENAGVGNVLGMIGPGGRGVPEADWTLLAGDETALPAIARTLEAMSPTARGAALIEVARHEECQSLTAPAGIEIRWLLRDEDTCRARSPLAEAVLHTTIPNDGRSRFVWVGCEFSSFKTVRHHLRSIAHLRSDEQLVVAYWRRS